MKLSKENQDWLKEFRLKHNRSPKVLHIGNIANNAYLNAKLLNQAGFDCDVICYDYYHIMGCPEWEDAEFSNSYGDMFRPNWYNAGIKGFNRPRWFAQGKLEDCIEYLNEKNRNNIGKANKIWQKLLIQSRVEKVNIGFGLYEKNYFFQKVVRFVKSKSIVTKVAYLCEEGSIGRNVRSNFLRLIISSVLMLLVFFLRLFLKPISLRTSDESNHLSQARYYSRVKDLINIYKSEFPDRLDVLTEEDVNHFKKSLIGWHNLLSCYDIVIAYSTDPIIPLMAGVPYYAFEHGTIRTIPYENNSVGRFTSLSYRLSQHTFVTNLDCKRSAEILVPNKHTLINHPFDEDHGVKIKNTGSLRRKLLKSLDSDFIFFHPSRHDWVKGSGYADKRNDVFLHAFGQLRAEGYRVGLVTCKWGRDVDMSIKLIEEYDCYNNTLWVEPQAIVSFERHCKASDTVVDQFLLGSFGGILFKAMALGVPVLTYLKKTDDLSHYAELPPVINCKEVSEIKSAVKELLLNPSFLKSLGKQSRKWIKKYHGKVETVNLQINQFREHLLAEQFNLK